MIRSLGVNYSLVFLLSLINPYVREAPIPRQAQNPNLVYLSPFTLKSPPQSSLVCFLFRIHARTYHSF